jgi:hypothetical protein
MDDDGADLPFLLPDVLPGLAGVAGNVEAVADLDVAADIRLAGADIDHIRIGGGDGDGADGGDGLVVEDGLPVGAAVGRLPDTARRGGGVIGAGIAGYAAGAADAAARGGTERAKVDALEDRGAVLVVGRLLIVGEQGGRDRQGEEGEQEGPRTCRDARGAPTG